MIQLALYDSQPLQSLDVGTIDLGSYFESENHHQRDLPVHVEEGKVLVLHLLDVGASRERLLVPRQHHRPNARILGFETTS